MSKRLEEKKNLNYRNPSTFFKTFSFFSLMYTSSYIKITYQLSLICFWGHNQQLCNSSNPVIHTHSSKITKDFCNLVIKCMS